MGDHGVKALGGNRLKPEGLLDTCMQKFYGPAPPVPWDNLAGGGPEISAGKRRAAPLRSVAPFSTHQLALAHRAQGACGVSDANIHALACVPTRRQTHGAPLAPAMTTENRVDGAPLPRWRGGQSERCRFDPAGFPQGDKKVPAFVGHSRFDFFVV